MINHYDNESRLTEILRCVVDQTADATMLQQLGPARTREEIFVSRALGKKPWAAIPPRTTLEMWLAFIAEDTAEPAHGSYTVRSCAESCIITYARRVKGATAIIPIFPPHDPYEIALAKLAGIIPVSYGVQGRPWELLINQLAGQGPRGNVAVIYGSTPRHEDGQISPMQDLHGYDRPWAGGDGVNLLSSGVMSRFNNANNYGVAYIVQEDGSVHAAGTVTVKSWNFSTVYAPLDELGLAVGDHITVSCFGDDVRLIVQTLNENNTILQSIESTGAVPTAAIAADTTRIRMYLYCKRTVPEVGDVIDKDIYPMISKGSAIPTAWAPYANICPIIPGLDMLRDNGDRLVVWSGEIDAGSSRIISRSAEIQSYAGEQLPGPWISSMDAYDPDATPTTGAQVVYELPEPVIYRLTASELQRALGCTKYLGVGTWKLCPGVVTVISAQLTTGEETTHYDIAPSTAEGWSFEISVNGQTTTGAVGALSVAAGNHSITITATPAAGAAACYIHPTLYSEVTP